MEYLIKKWRRCAQKTGERVFISVKARVNRMGGLREMASHSQHRPWDDEPKPTDSQVEDKDLPEKEEEEEVEDEFTMEIMLKMLGVDEGIIGWDRGLCNFRRE
jgi:hypothetical protein